MRAGSPFVTKYAFDNSMGFIARGKGGGNIPKEVRNAIYRCWANVTFQSRHHLLRCFQRFVVIHV